MDVRAVPIDHPDAQKLIAELYAFYGETYGDTGDETVVAVDDFAPPRGAFLVGYVDDEPVASGGWRARDADPSDPAVRDGDAEVKRMFVASHRRGRGYGRAMLAALERSALAAGRTRAILETGTPQSAAIALYTAAGYARMPSFGHYRASPMSRCYAKALLSAPPAASPR
ncbi:GNAT family N-acetyltransferase [Pseudonocardia sp. CA-107938]|uniref:GNAT family N-acetyltransferase n=1 Tax=Pseudonocardia sp. CA-107938 TaxID=3240021 RepID=UPI003D8EB67F